MDIKTTFHNDVIHIELARPHAANALDENLLITLTKVLKSHNHAQIKALVLSGQGKHFCAGADINWMKRAKKFSQQENIEDAKILAECLEALYQFHAPVISMVHGACYGGGLGLLACSDIVIAEENTKFCFSEVKLGLIPVTISPYIVQAIGARQATKLFLTAEVFSAQDAENFSLVHKVCTSAEIEHEKNRILEQLLENGPHALTACKSLIRKLTPHSKELMESLPALLATIRVSNEAQERLTAFLAKK